jgi:uncharacterized cupredoxin-like copper-binding protein
MKNALFLLLAIAAGGALADTGHGASYRFGSPAQPADATRTVKVDLTDDRKIQLEPLTIRQGETILFVVTNTGKQKHEFSIGDTASQRAHAAMMKKMPDMHHDNDPTTVSVNPGETRELAWKFDKPVQGEIVFACHVAGHYEAGMLSKAKLVN